MTWRYEPRWCDQYEGYRIVESYYDGEKPYGYCDAMPFGTDLEELENDLEHMLKDVRMWRAERFENGPEACYDKKEGD